MAIEPKRVLVIQDASKELNLRVFYWVMNGLSLKPADMVTLLAILHEVYTPMGYKSIVNNRAMVGVNQRIIDEQLARKKEEYQKHEGLARVAKLYESNEVAFKIQLFTGSSPKDIALNGAINLKATWVILDRQMKKDEDFFLQNLSCGISRVRRKNRIVRLRGPLDLAVEIQCNSHETYDESLPESPCEDFFSIDIVSRRPVNVEGVSQIHCSPDMEEGCSTFTTNINEKTCQTSPDHPSMDETDINSDQMTGNIEGDKQCQDQDHIQRMPHENGRDTTLVINNDQTTTQEIVDQRSQDAAKTHNFFHDKERYLRHPTKSEEIIDQTKDDQLSQNQAQQTHRISHGGILDGQQEKSILENSVCSLCSVCKTRRPNIEWQKEFTYEELETATDGFSLKNCLSESGHLFSTFRGQLEGELKIVVKQHEITNTQLKEKMKSEVQTILKARHKNVVMLLGSSTKDRFMLIVYEYACNGSLDKYLSRDRCRPLTWSERLRVAIGLSRGLKYLHDNNIIHGNIKPSNILLTHDFKPLLGDFGLGKKLEVKKSYNNKNTGNSEYIAPEYQEKGKLSTKIDVYSFGVIILELITGRKATDKISGEKSLVGWAKPLLGGKKYSELVDPIISNSYEEDQLRWLVQVTAQCLKKNHKERLSMNMVVSALQGIADSEQCHIAEDLTSATSYSRTVPDTNGSQVQALSTLQGTADSKQCCMTEDITPVVSYSRSVPDINGSQGPRETDPPSQKEKQIENSSFEEERRLRLRVENNHFYMIDQRNSDTLNQIEEQVQSRPRGVDRSSEKMIINDHMMDQTVVAQLSEFQEQMKSTLNGEGISTQKISIDHMIGQTNVDKLSQDQEEVRSFVQMKRGLRPVPISGMIVQTKADHLIKDETQLQSSSNENLMDRHQDEIILEKSKSSACSICKSKRPKIAQMKDFTYDELLEATEGFSVENSLSEREDGPTFKGLLESKVKIAVKKYQITRSQEEKTFKSEFQLLTNARHKNVVMLLGLCTVKSQLMIVYEQVCNGSLDHYLSRGNFQSLTWRERMKVAIGTARGLKYLHGNNIIHGSIKASNILLTHDFESLIGDFGFGKVKLEPKKSYKDKSARDSGYTAPEHLENGKLSTKTDVYSFGVVLLELITGRRAMDKLPGGKSLVRWARPLLGGKKYPQLVDPKISNSYEEEQLRWLVQVTEQCLRKNPKERFTMNMVVSALQDIAESDECCVIEDSSPEESYLPNDEPAMTSSQGQMKADPVSWEQEWIDRKTYKEERSFRIANKTDHMIAQVKDDQLKQNEEEMQNRPHGEDMSRVAIISNHMIEQTNPDQQIQEKQQNKEEIEKKEIDKQQKVSKGKKQMQGSCDGDLLNENQGNTILEHSKSSVCSICKSRRPNNGWQRKFTYEELQAATEGFSIKYSLSEGEYGPAFRGQLDNKLKIAIKQHQVTSLQEEKVFMSEVQLLTNARHENVIMLLGSCIRENQLLIVYEYACNGSLDQYLSRESGRSLTWRERVKIAIGVSRGLKYLHENNIINGRIKPSNILLNHDYKPLLGDFVFGKERCELKNSSKDKRLQNCGYTAPECLGSGKLSTKADVYSFGAVLLELITGCMISDKKPGQKCLIEWARPLLGGKKYLQLLDPKISSSYDEQELASLVLVTEKCLRKNPKERFTMNMVVSAMPCVVDSNDIYVTEDSSSEKSDEACYVPDVARSKVEEELLEEEDLGREISEEREDNVTCSRSNGETETGEEGGSYTIYGETCKETTQEKESTSTMVCQDGERCESYGGARDFFLEGAQEYMACQEFFGLCNSI